MQKIINIKSKNKNYNIIVEKNSVLKNILNEVKINNKTIVLIDSKLINLYKKLKRKRRGYSTRMNKFFLRFDIYHVE